MNMKKSSIGILCIQETRVNSCPYFASDGFLSIYSGRDDNNREHAGVGFISAPWMRRSIKYFVQIDSRLAVLQIRTYGGIMIFISAYAPPNTHEDEERLQFFDELEKTYCQYRSYDSCFICEDLNSRIIRRLEYEKNILGSHIFENMHGKIDIPLSNRNMILQMYSNLYLRKANIFFDHDTSRFATYYVQLNFILIDQYWLN